MPLHMSKDGALKLGTQTTHGWAGAGSHRDTASQRSHQALPAPKLALQRSDCRVSLGHTNTAKQGTLTKQGGAGLWGAAPHEHQLQRCQRLCFALRCSQEPPPVVGHTHRLRRDARTGPTGHQQPMTTTWTRPSGLTRHDHCAVKHCWSMYSSPPLPPPSRDATQARLPSWAPTTVPGSAPRPLLRVAKHQVTLPASIALNQYRVNHSKHDTDPDWVPTVRAGESGPGRDIACSPRQTHITTHTQHVALWEHVHTAPCTYAHGTGPAEGCCQGTPSSITAMAYQAVQVCRWQHTQPTKGLDLPWNRDTSCRTKV